MKKALLATTLLLATTISGNAQEVYSQIKQRAQEVLDNTSSNIVMKKISKFKVDELDYMAMKMQEVMPDSSVTFLDQQAFAMNSFMNLYVSTILKANTQPETFQIKLIKLFMDATYSNPLFNDEDKEVTLSYFSRGDSLTRFSLDTDWRRAIAAVMKELEKEEYKQ